MWTELPSLLKRDYELIQAALPLFLFPEKSMDSNGKTEQEEKKPEQVIEAMKYSVLGQGKRIRSLLMLQIARTAQKDNREILPAACAIEFIHTASLILDDLPCMDNAKLRRGKPCLHLTFGEATAILAAISLLFKAFQMLGNNAQTMGITQNSLLAMFHDLFHDIGVEGMIAGQHFDVALQGIPIAESMVQYICQKKTSPLFESCVKITCTLCNIPNYTQECLLRYARHLALAFQIADDLLDVMGDEGRMQKDKNQDANKITYPRMYGIEESQKKLHQLVSMAKEEILHLPNKDGLIYLIQLLI